ncbi:MAG: gamma-glutamyltransferase family protein [Alphaproteobacteria bacterium]|nr:gamma-glutamyltransferase family protein [Alphaproteobacteria bacterium]
MSTRARSSRWSWHRACACLTWAALNCAQAQHTAPLTPAQPEAATARQATAIGVFQHRAVVSAHALASRAGERVLSEGGNAIDAAVATQWVLSVVEPQSSGLGGGGFAVVFDGRQAWAYDGREAAPQSATPDWFMKEGIALGFEAARRSPRSVGVPGLVPMLWSMHQRHGRRPWASVLSPAIELAEQGFAITPRLHQLLQIDPLLRQDPWSLKLYYNDAGLAHPVGQVLRNPELAWVLRRIAALGPRAMNEGPVAQALLRRLRDGAGHDPVLTARDLRDYTVRVEPALCFQWPALPQTRLCGAPPPSSGTLAVGQLLNLLDRLGLTQGSHPDQAAPRHAYIEAARLAYADRAAYIGDPAQVVAPSGGWPVLLDPAYLGRRAALIQGPRMPRAEPGEPAWVPFAGGQMPDQAEYGTTHLNVVDAQGLAVALSSSLESAFGARRMVNTGAGRKGGFLLNHQLTDFALQPKDEQGRMLANAPGPGKRPRSSMTPMLVLSATPGSTERVTMALGSAGGPFIIHHVAQSLWALAQGLDDPERIADLPRFGLTDPQGPIWLEAGTRAADWVTELQSRGHAARVSEMSSGAHLLWRRSDGAWVTLADPRREGLGAGL